MNLPQETLELDKDIEIELLEDFSPLNVEKTDYELSDNSQTPLKFNNSSLKYDLSDRLESRIGNSTSSSLEDFGLETSHPLLVKMDSSNLNISEISGCSCCTCGVFRPSFRGITYLEKTTTTTNAQLNSGAQQSDSTDLSDPVNIVNSNFDIVINFIDNTLTASQQEVFKTAEAIWESILVDIQPNDFDLTLTIDATAPAIDGDFGVLGSAGPTAGVDLEGFIFATEGIMRFDSADVARLEAEGTFDDVIVHEMAHVIGLGTLWTNNGLYSNDTGKYNGANALAAYQTEYDQPNATAVPVELDGGSGTANGHWDENATSNLDPYGRDFGKVLMTGSLDSSPFISKTTIGSFKDMGFVVAAPTITSSATASVLENQTSAIDVNASDDRFSEGSGLTYSIRGGDDASLFSVNPTTGEVRFKDAPDFENPSDSDGDNNYEVQVKVSNSQSTVINPDGDFNDIQNITITVTNEEVENDGEIDITVDGSTITYQESDFQSYANQDITGSFSLENNNLLELNGNNWKSIPLNFDITANTVLSFEFKSDDEGEIHGIGFDDNNIVGEDKTFNLYGSQTYGIADFDYTTPGEWQSFTINVGDYYTGAINNLFFANDDDANASANSQFRNISITESQELTTAGNNDSGKVMADNATTELNFSVKNKVTGTVEVDNLIGTPENDWIDGDQDNDQLTGNGGRDIFVITENQGTDTITDFTLGEDKIGLFGNLNYSSLTLKDSFGNTIISSGEDTLAILTGINSSEITSTEFMNF